MQNIPTKQLPSQTEKEYTYDKFCKRVYPVDRKIDVSSLVAPFQHHSSSS